MSELNLFSEVMGSDNAQTISSREIAELTNKRHDHVLRDIDVLNDSYGKLHLPKVGEMFNIRQLPNGGSVKDRYFELTRMQTMDLMTGYSSELRIKVNRRWEELEKRQHQVPQSFSEALMLAAKQAKVIEDQQKQLEVQAPKVLFSDAVASSKSSCLIGELAKLISQNGFHIGQNRLFQWMRKNGYLGSFGNRYNIPMQQYIEQGLFEIKEGVRTDNDGVLHTTITTKVTGKGQVYFINKFLGGVVRL